MSTNVKNRSRFRSLPVFVLCFFIGFFSVKHCVAAPPVNDSCTRATVIAIPAGGYGLGTFTSAQTDLTSATVQTGETFAPAIFVAGLDKKSVWYRFSIPTIRAVRVTLTQPGTAITAGDVGFAVYEANACLPGNSNISSKLTPIVTFGNTYHPCVPSGEYLIQVSSNLNAKGPITVQVEISDQTGAAYDHPDQAYAFGQVKYYAQKIDFNTECQSIEDATEVCNAFANKGDYNKSAWLTFTTPAYFDYMIVQLSGTGVSTYFPSNNNQPTYRKFGYTLYKGDAVVTPIAGLTTVSGCDSLETNGYYAGYKVYKCGDLQPGTTYSIQLFIKKDFGDDVRLGILAGGQVPTKGPKPILSAVPSPNAIGNLAASPAGTLTQVDDVWGCNSRHNTSVCNPALPDSGIVYGGGRYNLSSFFTFTLTNTSAINFNAYVTQCGPQPLVRVFKQGLTNNCGDLDTANLIGTFNNNGTIDCLSPGDYTVQVSGQDYTVYYGYFHYGTATYNSEQCLSTNLGTGFRLDMRAYTRKAANKFSLDVTGAVDSINKAGNVMAPLAAGISYKSVSDTMGCQNTLRFADTTCSPVNNKVIYREFNIGDSGVVDFSNLTYTWTSPWRYRLYSGDASALASAQNVHAFPDKVAGLTPKTECFDGYISCNNKRACVLPGTYTFATMGGDADVGRVDQPTFTFVRTRTKHNSPATAQNLGSIMDTLGPNGGTITTDVDDWSCTDNAVTINGYEPCTIAGKPATKAIYRQFYLKEPALVRIDNIYYYYCMERAYGIKTLFYGKATDGLSGLSPVGGAWNCFQAAGSTVACDLLPAGWYTVVSYQQGPSYENPLSNLNLEGRYNSAVSYNDEYKIIITPTCPGPKYNRPHKAAIDVVTKEPFLVTWGDRFNSTTAYPKKDSTYALPTEYFNCLVDTPFSKHPIKSCEPSLNRVAYYVFKITQVSFLQINAGGYYAALYDKDVRKDSAQFPSLTPLQPCSNAAGFIQFCFFQPGTYTLVIFAGDASVCKSVTPSIYIDEIGYSRFDYANKAYDFGIVPPDSTYHYGKVGDVNPVSSGRKPSSDLFYCTTGASEVDPTEPVCATILNPNVYNNGPNKPLYDSAFPPSKGITRRNLWYTFVVNQPGYVKVKVESKTPKREYQQKFSVYQSNVDGTMPFSSVVSSGEVDSTITQGLKHIGTNQQTWYYCANLTNEVSFYRDPCTAATTRYYVLVENVNAEPYESGGTLPNTQTEVSVLVDSVNLVLPKHDHYSEAGDIGTVGVGTYTGDTDNYSCATKDATDPVYYYGNYGNCRKTLWYKFTATITGNVRYRIYVNGTRKYDYYDVQLFRQIIPNDSTTQGLQIVGYTGVYGTDNTYWAQTCVSPGTYYLLLPGCDQVGAYVYPEIELIEATGDFCSRPIKTELNGAGSVTATVLVNCHTIGTDYGEFGPQLTCPQGANTAEYKSSWFRMDIGGTDTLDVTTYLVENTNASSSDIKYRLMTGDCGAMQEQSCVLDALTQNTYQCLVPGQSYYVQVFTPVSKFNQAVTGTIDLKLSAIAHADTCAPLTNCLANANFNTLFDCNTDDSVKFVNFSTYGTSIQYKWHFGYNGQTSTDVSPSFFYPALSSDQTYSVKLVVENTSCGRKDSVTKTITVPGRPYINLGSDVAVCDTTSFTLKAPSHNGATWLWQNGSTADTLLVTTAGNNDYSVKINYNGCSSADTVKVLVSPIASRPLQNIILCTDSVSISAYRGNGETYQWSNGSTASSMYVSTPGIYWVDIKYFSCTYRDSFVVNNLVTARPLGNDTMVCLSAKPFVLHANTGGAVSYLWQDGSTADSFTVKSAGQYNVAINFGSCTVYDTIHIAAFLPAVMQSIDTAICYGQSLTLPWGIVADTAGIYMDTVRYRAGCDSLISKVNLTIYPKPDIGKDTTLCLAQNPFILDAVTVGAISYQWQDNSTSATYNVTQPGLYWVDIDFGNCSARDSIIISGSAAPSTTVADTSICFGSSLVLSSGSIVTTAGIYRDTISSSLGCDSLINVVNLTIRPKPVLGTDTTVVICGGNNVGYTLPSGKVVNAPGVYHDTLRGIPGCDSLVRAYTVKVITVTKVNIDVVICSGLTYTLPSGTTVSTAGLYEDTLRSTQGCDSIITTVNLKISTPISISSAAVICAGQTYMLPSGTKVNKSGMYNDTLKNSGGCDSLITKVTLTVYSVKKEAIDAVICAGSTYTLPSGSIESVTGIYSDTIKSAYGCDSLITTINLQVEDTKTVSIRPVICAGTTYTLPSGIGVSVTGIYNDTLKSISGCDSLITIVNLTVQSPQKVAANALICAGQTYTLPSGVVVSATGIYNDTIRSIAGCDSLITTVNLTVYTVKKTTVSAVVCAGQSYTLPSGITVSTTGIFNDTIRNIHGCDSLVTTANLIVNTTQFVAITASICAGQVYAMPSGLTVNAAGVYNDTLKYVSGCDSLITTLTLSVVRPTFQNTNATVCKGQTYRLPSGRLVNLPATYYDTIRSVTGCDSLIFTVNLIVFSPAVVNESATICAGQTYTLPSGQLIKTAGVYNDTLRNSAGCDSLITTVNLTVQNVIFRSNSVSICLGQAYTLPGGKTVNTSGTYTDTLKTTVGCDSLVNEVILTVLKPSFINMDASICYGQTYTLLSGRNITDAGTYQDTVRSIAGCDSIISSVKLRVLAPSFLTQSVSICEGGSYTLPSGRIVDRAGIYNDTIRYQAGCDSIITTVDLFVKPVSKVTTNAFVCSGQNYMLPWGVSVNVAGVYRDTIRYINGCDSLVRTVNLAAIPAKFVKTAAAICIGERYTLPSGRALSLTGIYRDTLKSSLGCDSSIMEVNLTVNPAPTLTITKSNDVDCVLGTTQLAASGASKYVWSPASLLNNANVRNPVALPVATTVYKVQATSDKGCVAEDSIEVKVLTGNVQNGYLVASAFTPNGDGKNDCFGVKTWGNITDLEFSIFDRMGYRVFYTQDVSKCWDGTTAGERLGSAAYVYQISANTICGRVFRKGTVVLIR